MTSTEHSKQAEAYLRAGDVARAQVHATLAQAAATRDQSEAMRWIVGFWEMATRPARTLMLLSAFLGDAAAERSRR